MPLKKRLSSKSSLLVLFQAINDDIFYLEPRPDRIQLIESKSEAVVLQQVEVQRELDRVSCVQADGAEVALDHLERVKLDLVLGSFRLVVSMTPLDKRKQ